VPSSFQYPVERDRDLQRRWGRLLHGTAAPNEVRNTVGLRKITIDAGTPWPRERATKLAALRMKTFASGSRP
jgi:hypothetical protein